MTTWIIIILAGFVLASLVLGVIMFVNSAKKDGVKEETKGAKNLDTLINEAKTANEAELDELIKLFLQDQKLPPKNSSKLSADAKKKLGFITALTSNQNATAKHISFLNRELAKKYSAYKKDIDAYEQIGVANRNIRAKS
ncbi:hypothetical protein [Campylobacter troglodytis]|uniref:hypothetical protein n=1 Tax=Campylobacter troglodytis TaxID=654363 RepID=UPI00115891B3|nr:hypothetical protein [Campylobacter troglodytis]TQR61025.1 hypothetical protein DMC01_03170 [Campylobacter troglodytis]